MKKKLPQAVYIGQVAVFYIPAAKLDMPLNSGTTARTMLHDFFVKNYNAYTHEKSAIQGYWTEKDILVRDEHERYEVSFRGKKKVRDFVEFLAEVCGLIQEQSLYLTMGYKSWLIVPNAD